MKHELPVPSPVTNSLSSRADTFPAGYLAGYCFMRLPCPHRRFTQTPQRGWNCTSGPRTPTATPCVPTASVPAACCSGSRERRSGSRRCRGPRPTPRSRWTWRSWASSPPFTNFKVTAECVLTALGCFRACVPARCLREPHGSSAQ